MNKAAPSPGRIFVIAGFALSCFGLLLFLWLAFGGAIPFKPKGYRIQVAFPDAAQLAEQADVRIAGVSVGKVISKQLAPEGNRTLATLQIDEKFVPIKRDAKAVLRTKTLLGETYVEMTAGSPGAPVLDSGGRLGDAKVAETVEFDELLRIWDKDTRKAFQAWQRTTAQATRGRARDINDALGSLPIWAESAQGIVDTLNSRRTALRRLIRNTGTTFEAITRDEAALRDLIVQNAEVFDTLSARREALAESIRIFPTFQAESRAVLRRLATFSENTEPLIRDLEPVLEEAQPTLRSLQRLSPELIALFEDIPELVRAAEIGFPPMADVLRGLEPTLAAVGPFLQQVNPILRFGELYQAQISDFLNIGPSALAIKVPKPPDQPQTNGHALPQLIVTGSQSLPAEERDRENRGNAYLAPDALAATLNRKFLVPPNWDCSHIGGPRLPSEDIPGCFVQGPIPFQGEPLRRYPHVNEAREGGRLRTTPR